MDTDDLSKATYNGILIQARKFNPDLTLQFGVLASSCNDDDDYLNQAEIIIRNWLRESDIEEIIDDIFYGEPVNEKEFIKTLDKILSNIAEIRKTPMEEREYED